MTPLKKPRTLSYSICKNCEKEFSVLIGEEPENYVKPQPKLGTCSECQKSTKFTEKDK